VAQRFQRCDSRCKNQAALAAEVLPRSGQECPLHTGIREPH
jgi:hypothetical protein